MLLRHCTKSRSFATSRFFTEYSSPHVVHTLGVSVRQVQESLTPLAAALSEVVAYADTWGPGGFPVPVEQEASLPQTHDSADSSAATSVQQALPPNPLLLHRAVWAQAEVLARRCHLLLHVGETLSAEIRKKTDLVRENVVLRLCKKGASIGLNPKLSFWAALRSTTGSDSYNAGDFSSRTVSDN